MNIGFIRKRSSGFILLGLVVACAITLSFWGVRNTSAQPQVIRIGGGTFLGVGLEDVRSDNMAKYELTKEEGAIVRSVEKGSPAEEAGLQEGDVILEYAGMPVFSTAHLARLVQETPAGRKINLVISRNAKRLSLAATIRERGASERIGRGDLLADREFSWQSPDLRAFRFDAPGGGRAFSFSVPDVGRPRLGITLQELTDQMAEFLAVPGRKGVLVTAVTGGSPADGKLKAGDVIISADGKAISNADELSAIIRDKDRGASVDLRVIRDKKEISVSVVLQEVGSRRPYRV